MTKINFGCKKHGIDYRLLCDDCKEKYDIFFKLSSKMIRKNLPLDEKPFWEKLENDNNAEHQ